MNDFLQRLRERRLGQWALACAAAAFALLQGLDIVAQSFGWVDGAQRVNGTQPLILTLLLGFSYRRGLKSFAGVCVFR